MASFLQNNYNKNNYFSYNNQINKSLISPFNPLLINTSKNKFVSNISHSSAMSFQDRVIAFGQDRDENYFKQTLRKPSGVAIKSTYYNMIHNHSPANALSVDKGNSFSSRHPQMNAAIQHISNLFNNNSQEQIEAKIGRKSTKNTTNNIITHRNKSLLIKPSSKIEKISKDLKEYHELYSSAVIEYSYLEDPNIYHREYMEDKGQSIDCFNNNSTDALFSLFDGHGGIQVSKYLQENLSLFFKSMLPSSNIEATIVHLFDVLDEKIRLSNYSNVGSTACMVYFTTNKETNNKMLYCANVGDTRCVLISKTCAKRLSYDHRAADESECERIIKAGGLVYEGRVYGQLMLSRSFGDFEFKPYGVIGVPDITKVELNSNDQYVIIATDGIWDVLNDEDMFKISQEVTNSKDFVHRIIKEAMLKGSMDNISCFAIKLN